MGGGGDPSEKGGEMAECPGGAQCWGEERGSGAPHPGGEGPGLVTASWLTLLASVTKAMGALKIPTVGRAERSDPTELTPGTQVAQSTKLNTSGEKSDPI